MFITLLVFLIILGIVAYLIGLIPMDIAMLQIIRTVIILIAILGVTDALGITRFGVLAHFGGY